MEKEKKNKFLDVVLSICIILTSYFLFSFIPIDELNIQNIFILEFLAELLWTMFIIILLIIFKKLKMFKFDVNGIKNGWTAGMPLITIIAIAIIDIVIGNVQITAYKFEIIFFIAQMFLVGFCEETLFRGLLQNSIHDLLNEQKISQVRIAIIISGALFGFMHLSNARIIGFLPALSQAISASFVGMMMCAIYYRTNKNLWYNIFLHSLNDAVIITAYGGLSGVSEVTILENTNAYGFIEILIPALFYGIITCVLLRKKKIKKLLK